MNPNELLNLASRIDRLQRVNTQDWGGDELEFRNKLPTGRDPQKLPDTRTLREMAERKQYPTPVEYRLWLTVLQHLEYLVIQNDPHNPRRIIHDMVRGKMPTW